MLFKDSLNIKAEEIKKYISVNVSLELDTLKPYIVQAESKFIKKLLGNAQYNELLDYYNASSESGSGFGVNSGSGSGFGSVGATPENLQQLLEFVQRSLINLSCYLGFDFIISKIGNQGAYRIETDKQKGLYQYQEVNLRNSFKSFGFDGLDDVLDFLEENKNDFPNWKNSATYTITKQSFINTTKDFNDIYSINESRLVFLSMQRYIKVCENTEVIAMLGQPLFDELKQEILSDTITPANLKILPFIKIATVFLTVSRAANETGLTWSDKGLYFEFSDKTQNMRMQQLADSDRLQTIIRNARKTANDALENVREIMVNNIDDYPLYKQSNVYNKGDIPRFNNNGKKTFIL